MIYHFVLKITISYKIYTNRSRAVLVVLEWDQRTAPGADLRGRQENHGRPHHRAEPAHRERRQRDPGRGSTLGGRRLDARQVVRGEKKAAADHPRDSARRRAVRPAGSGQHCAGEYRDRPQRPGADRTASARSRVASEPRSTSRRLRYRPRAASVPTTTRPVEVGSIKSGASLSWSRERDASSDGAMSRSPHFAHRSAAWAAVLQAGQ